MTSVVCYHYPCPDGIFAALAAHLAHKKLQKSVRWHPLTVFKPPDVQQLDLKGSETVYFLDYTGPPGFPEAVARNAGNVIVLDHHKTAHESLAGRTDLPGNLHVVIDIERSGATIARDHFQCIHPLDDDLALRFRYIEDADLWRWRLPDSRAFHAGLAALRLEYDVNRNPAIFDALLALPAAAIIGRGQAAMSEQEATLDVAMAHRHRVQLGGAAGAQRGWGQCLAVFAGDTAQSDAVASLRSTLGNRLAELSESEGLAPVGVVAYDEPDIGDDSKVKVSLRGTGPYIDTAAMCQVYGGGGHAKASSCIMARAEFETWRL